MSQREIFQWRRETAPIHSRSKRSGSIQRNPGSSPSERGSRHGPKRVGAVQMPRSMQQKQDGQLGEVAESVVGQRALALASGEKVAPQEVLHLIGKCGDRQGKRKLLYLRKPDEAAGDLQQPCRQEQSSMKREPVPERRRRRSSGAGPSPPAWAPMLIIGAIMSAL